MFILDVAFAPLHISTSVFLRMSHQQCGAFYQLKIKHRGDIHLSENLSVLTNHIKLFVSGLAGKC